MEQAEITSLPQVAEKPCATCRGTDKTDDLIPDPSFVYALGRIEARFPNLALEKEFTQALGREDAAGLSDRQAFHKVLSQRSNRYLVRQLCWVLKIEGLDTYILRPRDPVDFDLLVETTRSELSMTDLDLVIGIRGSIAPSHLCNGLTIPIVIFDQIYSFERDTLVEAIPRPKHIPEDQENQFRVQVGELFDRMQQIADNAGETDEHRALNYLAVRYPAIYAQAVHSFSQNFALAGVEVRPSALSYARNIVEVIFSYTNRQTDVSEKYFVRVDVTEEFPFLVNRLSPFYDR